MKKLFAAILVLAAGLAEATPPPRGGVMWVTPAGVAVAPYLPNLNYYFDDAGFIWKIDIDGGTVGASALSYMDAYFESTDCSGTAWTVTDPNAQPPRLGTISVAGGFLAVGLTQESTVVTVLSGIRNGVCTTSPWPIGSQWAWLKSALVSVSGPPSAVSGPLHLEWR